MASTELTIQPIISIQDEHTNLKPNSKNIFKKATHQINTLKYLKKKSSQIEILHQQHGPTLSCNSQWKTVSNFPTIANRLN